MLGQREKRHCLGFEFLQEDDGDAVVDGLEEAQTAAGVGDAPAEPGDDRSMTGMTARVVALATTLAHATVCFMGTLLFAVAEATMV